MSELARGALASTAPLHGGTANLAHVRADEVRAAIVQGYRTAMLPQTQ